VSFRYDALGRRIVKTIGATVQGFTYDGEDILREVRSASSTWIYTHGPGIDEPLARINEAGAWRYFHADGLGSIVAITNSGGVVTETIDYDPFGQLLSGSPPRHGFTGREWDGEIGMYYYRARYYDPKIGRFISEDPIGFEGGLNRYAYVDNNPVRYTDPAGLIKVCQRKAEKTWMAKIDGNHAYYWDDRLRNHMTPRDCGRAISSGAGPGTTGVEAPDPRTTDCYDVPGSDGLDDAIMICCRDSVNAGAGDCHKGLKNCLEEFGLSMPAGVHRFGCSGSQCSGGAGGW
jgi:RHS repeat-associated protein